MDFFVLIEKTCSLCIDTFGANIVIIDVNFIVAVTVITHITHLSTSNDLNDCLECALLAVSCEKLSDGDGIFAVSRLH